MADETDKDEQLPSFESLQKKYADLPPPDVRIQKAKDCKEHGNQSYQEKFYDRAANSYQEAIDAIENEYNFTAFEARDAKELRVVCHSNLAQCMINVGKYYLARKSCDAALEIDDEHSKTLYRRGLAHMNLSAYEAARKDFKCALALEPDNKKVQKQLDKLQRKVDKHKLKEQKVFKKAFENLDGVFSDNRDTHISWYEKWMRWMEAKTHRYGPWVMNLLPLLVLSGRALHINPTMVTMASKNVCSLIFLCIGFVQLRLAFKNKNWLPSWLPYGKQIGWFNGSVSMLLGWTMVMARSAPELSLASKVGILSVVLNGGLGLLGESSGGSVKERGVRASSLLMLLALLTGHTT